MDGLVEMKELGTGIVKKVAQSHNKPVHPLQTERKGSDWISHLKSSYTHPQRIRQLIGTVHFQDMPLPLPLFPSKSPPTFRSPSFSHPHFPLTHLQIMGNILVWPAFSRTRQTPWIRPSAAHQRLLSVPLSPSLSHGHRLRHSMLSFAFGKKLLTDCLGQAGTPWKLHDYPAAMIPDEVRCHHHLK